MIRFRVHDPSLVSGAVAFGGGRAGTGSGLACAHLVGADGRPARGTIGWDSGAIACAPADAGPVGIALLLDLGARGRMMLQTCFLPTRAEPYELFVELARALIKQYVEECETWQMWNPALSGDSIEKWESAREVFREALRSVDRAAAERLARRAVELGLDAGETMTLRHADHMLARRHRRKAPSATTLGICVDPETPLTPAATAAARVFDVIALRTPWRLIERVPGKPDFSAVEAWAKWAAAERKAVVLGPIVDFGTRDGVPVALPDHVAAMRGDAKRFREAVWFQARRVVERLGAYSPLFIAASGANCAGWHDEGLDRMIELTRTATFAVRDVKRAARVVVELQSPAAESWRGVKGTAWPTAFLQRLAGENLGLTAAGVRFVQGGAGDPVRDFMRDAALLDGYVGRETSVFVTGFGVPSADTDAEFSACGSWRGRWSPETQARWGDVFLRVALARTFIEGAWWSRLQDLPGGPKDGVLDAAGAAKPVLEKLLRVRKSLASAAARAAGGART